MRGYSQHIIEENAAAEETVGVLLGRLCIKKRIPATDVARALGVSRQTVYDWFTGKSRPTVTKTAQIQKFMEQMAVMP